MYVIQLSWEYQITLLYSQTDAAPVSLKTYPPSKVLGLYKIDDRTYILFHLRVTTFAFFQFSLCVIFIDLSAFPLFLILKFVIEPLSPIIFIH